MKRIIILFVICFVISGCTVKSEINVKPNGKVKENVTIMEDNSYFKDINADKEQFVNNMITKYKSLMGKKKYSYEYIEKSGLTGANAYRTYKNICEYFGNSYFNQYVYKYFRCEEDDYYYVIENGTEYIPYCSDCSDWPRLDNVTLEINLPVAASEHNADSVKNNTYIWEYGKNAIGNKNFYLKISKSALNESYKQYLKNQENIKLMKKITGLVVFLAFFIGIVLITMNLRKKYKENQIEY